MDSTRWIEKNSVLLATFILRRQARTDSGGQKDKWTNIRMRDPRNQRPNFAAKPEKLRETATDLMEHAALLITKSVELERLIAGKNKPKKIFKIAHYQSTVSRLPSALRQNSQAFFSDKFPSERLFEYAKQSGDADRLRHACIEILVRETHQEAYPVEQATLPNKARRQETASRLQMDS